MTSSHDPPNGGKSSHPSSKHLRLIHGAAESANDTSATKAARRERHDKLIASGLAALGVTNEFSWQALDKLSVTQLLAAASHVINELDPAEDLMQSVADELELVQSLLVNVEKVEMLPHDETLHRVYGRLGRRAAVAAELHRRERKALLDAVEAIHGGRR